MVGTSVRAHRLNVRMELLAGLERRSRSERRWASVSMWLGVTIIGAFIVCAIAAPLIGQGGPNELHLAQTFQPPSWSHLFGTDNLGRDIFTRAIYAGRIDLVVGFIVTYIPVFLGVAIGLIAGYYGGWIDTIIMRAVDVVIAFPFIVFVIAVIAIVGPGLLGVYIGITLVGWSLYARLTRAEVLVIKEQQFVLAAKSLGYSDARVMLRHILPSAIRPNLVFSTLDIVLNILLLASLSFLGIGLSPPTAEWGLMVSDGQTFLQQAWWISTVPGLVLILAGVGFSLIGDGLADRLGRGWRGRSAEADALPFVAVVADNRS